MSEPSVIYHGPRFPAEIFGHGVWLSYRLGRGLRAVEDLLAERGIEVFYETIRQRCRTLG